jgi:benzoyl-CoA reductase subunit D
MIVAGIDVGASSVKVIIMKDGVIVGKAKVPTELDRLESAKNCIRAALDNASWDYRNERVRYLEATGAGRKAVNFADSESTVVACDAKGIAFLNPEIRTVIDIGGDEARAVKLDSTGKVIDFALNEKCAAGSGAFVEAMARAMQVTLPEFSALSLKSTKRIPINAQCAVFAESEVVSLVHEETSREDICKAVHDAIASRIASMAKKVRIEEKVALVGGVACNKGFLDSLERELKVSFFVPDEVEYVGALGAAIIAGKDWPIQAS